MRAENVGKLGKASGEMAGGFSAPATANRKFSPLNCCLISAVIFWLSNFTTNVVVCVCMCFFFILNWTAKTDD